MVRRIRCLPSASVHDRSSASPSVGVSALSSSEFMNPHFARQGKGYVPTRPGIKRRAKEVIIHQVHHLTRPRNMFSN